MNTMNHRPYEDHAGNNVEKMRQIEALTQKVYGTGEAVYDLNERLSEICRRLLGCGLPEGEGKSDIADASEGRIGDLKDAVSRVSDSLDLTRGYINLLDLL